MTRSSSGSSHGSGSGSGSSSGYQSVREERELIKEKCQVELDSEEELTEASQVVTVPGGLHLVGDGAIASKVWINIYKYCQSLFFFLRELSTRHKNLLKQMNKFNITLESSIYAHQTTRGNK